MTYNFDEVLSRKGTQCIKYDAAAAFLGSDDLIPMWVADMDFRTPDFVIARLRERLHHEVLGYPFRQDGFANSIMNWESAHHGWEVKKEWINFCPGVVPAVNLAVLALTEPGDSVIVHSPVYFPFFSAVKDHGRNLVINPLVLKDGRLCMDFDDLEKKAKGARMIILSSPHNPGGSVWTKDELTRLGEICLKNKVFMVSDEIHCDLVYDPFKHIPLASLSEEISNMTLTAIAPSKTFNLSGLSTAATIIADETIRKKFNEKLEHLHIGLGNLFGNIALEEAYTHGYDWSRQLMDYLSKNLDFLEEYISSHLPEIKMIRPEATFLVWLDCRDMGMGDKELNEFFMQKAKLGLNPGIMFGQGGEGFMRLNIACPLSVLKQAMQQLDNALTAHKAGITA